MDATSSRTSSAAVLILSAPKPTLHLAGDVDLTRCTEPSEVPLERIRSTEKKRREREERNGERRHAPRHGCAEEQKETRRGALDGARVCE